MLKRLAPALSVILCFSSAGHCEPSPCEIPASVGSFLPGSTIPTLQSRTRFSAIPQQSLIDQFVVGGLAFWYLNDRRKLRSFRVEGRRTVSSDFEIREGSGQLVYSTIRSGRDIVRRFFGSKKYRSPISHNDNPFMRDWSFEERHNLPGRLVTRAVTSDRSSLLSVFGDLNLEVFDLSGLQLSDTYALGPHVFKETNDSGMGGHTNAKEYVEDVEVVVSADGASIFAMVVMRGDRYHFGRVGGGVSRTRREVLLKIDTRDRSIHRVSEYVYVPKANVFHQSGERPVPKSFTNPNQENTVSLVLIGTTLAVHHVPDSLAAEEEPFFKNVQSYDLSKI